jgi:hypothetical protein
MGAAQRNPSILFEAVAYVPLGLLRVLRRQKTRLRVKDCRFGRKKQLRSKSLLNFKKLHVISTESPGFGLGQASAMCFSTIIPLRSLRLCGEKKGPASPFYNQVR